MGNLLKRHPARVRAGWFEDFDRAPENPIRQPWKKWGTVGDATLNALGEMELPPVSGTNLGGYSYEFQAYDKHYGMEYEVWWPVIGAGESALSLFIMPNWAKSGTDWNNTLGIRLFHQPVGSGDTVRIQQWGGLLTTSTDVAVGDSPVAFNGNTLRLQVAVDDEKFVRAYLNDSLVCSGTLAAAFATVEGRRGMNFMNQSAVRAYFRNTRIVDRTALFPAAPAWNEIFVDDFNRANNATIGNGWTKIGNNAGIVSNSFATTGTTDGSRAVLRDTANTSGRARIEGVVGGAIGPNTNADSSLILCGNAAGTVGLAANIFADEVYISRYSTILSGNPPTFTNLAGRTTGIDIAAGDVIAFCVWDGAAWIEHNGARILYALGVNAVVPATNTWSGGRVERTSFANSHSWNSLRILNAA
ncbi:hypothetical protein ACTD5D_39700 [Nocardia takedensis]|uniref:hypothetical protein n=1 Tax=Nocardia takedensis TaxID=259390 RepID=UPI003F7679F7